jgi:hypothetical protein
MLSTILLVDLVLFCLIALWVGVINITGNTEQRGGVGFIAFVLTSIIIFVSIVLGTANVAFNLIWG